MLPNRMLSARPGAAGSGRGGGRLAMEARRLRYAVIRRGSNTGPKNMRRDLTLFTVSYRKRKVELGDLRSPGDRDCRHCRSL